MQKKYQFKKKVTIQVPHQKITDYDVYSKIDITFVP